MTMFHRLLGLIAVAAQAALISSQASAQAAKPPDAGVARSDAKLSRPGRCHRPRSARVIPVAALDADQVRITYIGHATFLIESPQLVRIATDYNDYVRPPVVPDIATMNHAHDTHYTDNPDPAIKYVLRGWGPSEDRAGDLGS